MTRTKDSDGDFLGRWSRLKRERETEPEPAVPAAADDAPPEPEKTDEEILEELGLPDPESLKPGDDFSAFMAKAVPERLRTRALRRLWASNPTIAAVDGLLDYADDFTDSAMVVENLQTAYRVGRGFLKDLAEEDESVPSDPGGAAAEESDPAPEADELAEAQTDAPEPPETREAASEISRDDGENGSGAPAPRRRARMVFHLPEN